MKISFYGSLAETIGREVEVPLPPVATIALIRDKLAVLYPAAAETLRRPTVRAYVDDVMAAEDSEVSVGSSLAFLPPLSGG